MKYFLSISTLAALLFFLGTGVPTYTYADTVLISAQVNSSGTTTGGTTGGSSGGGGGGGFIPTSQTSVHFSGRAYPLSRVTVTKNGVVAITTIAGPDAKFDVTLPIDTAGNYTFGVYSQDSKGVRSDTFSFPLVITSGATTDISGIFIAPTIDVDKSEVKKGDTITIFGQSIPESQVTISVHSEVETFHTVSTDKSGAYLLAYDTSDLELGKHETKSKTKKANEISPYGKTVEFLVGTLSKPKSACAIGDLNCDGKVNIVDFSIMAYWYQKPQPPATVDLNHDGKVTLVDFSILAYHWTG